MEKMLRITCMGVHCIDQGKWSGKIKHCLQFIQDGVLRNIDKTRSPKSTLTTIVSLFQQDSVQASGQGGTNSSLGNTDSSKPSHFQWYCFKQTQHWSPCNQ